MRADHPEELLAGCGNVSVNTLFEGLGISENSLADEDRSLARVGHLRHCEVVLELL